MEVIVCLENLVQNVGRLLCGAKETNSYAQNVDILCTYHRTRVKEGKVQSVQPVEDLRGSTVWKTQDYVSIFGGHQPVCVLRLTLYSTFLFTSLFCHIRDLL